MHMRGSRKFCRRGTNFDRFFLKLMRGGRVQIPLKAGHHRPASETPFKWRFHHRPASETPFKWRFAGVPMMAQHLMLA